MLDHGCILVQSQHQPSDLASKFENTTRSRDRFDLAQQQFIAAVCDSFVFLARDPISGFTTYPTSIKLPSADQGVTIFENIYLHRKRDGIESRENR